MAVNDSFARRVRAAIERQIEDEKINLVSNTGERAAGHVQGLMDALTLMETLYSEMNDEKLNRTET